jgi:hypothetical protein
MKKYIYELLMNHKKEIEGILDSPTKKIYKLSELKIFLGELEFLKASYYSSVLNAKDLVEFLIEKKYLTCVKFRTPRSENLYVLNVVDEYQLMTVLRPMVITHICQQCICTDFYYKNRT